VFSCDLVINPKNRTYLTKNKNELFVLINYISMGTEGVEMEKASKNTDLSLEVGVSKYRTLLLTFIVLSM